MKFSDWQYRNTKWCFPKNLVSLSPFLHITHSWMKNIFYSSFYQQETDKLYFSLNTSKCLYSIPSAIAWDKIFEGTSCVFASYSFSAITTSALRLPPGACTTINSLLNMSHVLSTTGKVRCRPEFDARLSPYRTLLFGPVQANSNSGVEITMLSGKREADNAPSLIPQLFPMNTGFPAVRNTHRI